MNEYNLSPITHVALKFNGETHSLPKPNRHHDIIRMIIQNDPDIKFVDAPEEDWGFLDADGKYLNRKQALNRATLTNQILDKNKVYARHHSVYWSNAQVEIKSVLHTMQVLHSIPTNQVQYIYS